MATGDTYTVCERCTRRFAVGNVPTNVCGDCDENQRLRTALAAAERSATTYKAECARLTESLAAAERQRDEALKNAPDVLREMYHSTLAGSHEYQRLYFESKAEVERLRKLCEEADRHLKDYEGDCVQYNRKATERAVWVVREEIKAALTPAAGCRSPEGLPVVHARGRSGNVSDKRMFPIQPSHKPVPPHPMSVPWSVAELAYSSYVQRYGRCQTLERLAERGGFCPLEMDDFNPGWRDQCSELTTLRQQLAALARECEAWRAWNSRRPYTPPADINEQRAFERVMESLHVTNETIPDLAAVAKGGSNG